MGMEWDKIVWEKQQNRRIDFKKGVRLKEWIIHNRLKNSSAKFKFPESPDSVPS